MSKFEEHYKLFYESETNTVNIIWKASSATIDDDYFMDSQRAYNRMIVDNNAKKTFIDVRNFKFAVRPSLQEQIAEELYQKAIDAGLCRVAIVNSKELISQLSIEQMIEEDESGTFVTRYFDDVDEAKSWLISQDV